MRVIFLTPYEGQKNHTLIFVKNVREGKPKDLNPVPDVQLSKRGVAVNGAIPGGEK